MLDRDTLLGQIALSGIPHALAEPSIPGDQTSVLAKLAGRE